MEPDCDLWVAVDGSYTNSTVLNNLPDKTVLLGRIRSDARLFYLPREADQAGSGRKRIYGDPAPTPEEIRQNESLPWQTVKAYASGRRHEFKVKNGEIPALERQRPKTDSASNDHRPLCATVSASPLNCCTVIRPT